MGHETLSFEIGSLVFRIDAYAPIAWLARLPFNVFQVSDELAADIHVCFEKANPADTDASVLDDRVQKLLLGVGCSSEDLSNPLLRYGRVREKLSESLRYSEHVTIKLGIHSLSIVNFVRKEIFVVLLPDDDSPSIDIKLSPTLIRSVLAHFPALLMHCSAVEIGGRVALFVACDEGGKSTVAKQYRPHQNVIVDDIALLRPHGQTHIVYPTPWGRMINPKKSGVLGGVFVLNQAPHFEISPISARNTIELLWNEHFFSAEYHIERPDNPKFFRSLPRIYSIRMFEYLSSICHSVPTYLMRFPKDYVDWDAIDRAMGG